jgi:hypothetical protein
MRNFPTSEAKSQAFSGRRIVLLDVVTASHEVTLGQNAYKWRQVGDILVDVGPRLEGITVHTQLADKTAAFAFKLRGSWSLDGVNWVAFSSDLSSVITSNGSQVSAEYTTRTDLGRHIRIELGTTDTGSVEHGIINVMVALRFYLGA